MQEGGANAATQKSGSWGERLGLASLAGLALYFLSVSWRKWPDPLVDFGRELYLPWQLSQGALLYRDAEDFYGPLSQYLNAGLFHLFGPGLMVLVLANLVIWAAIVVLVHQLFRNAWGHWAAIASTAVFICVFSFSQVTGFGNYNFATPYSHEATHGFLACLALVPILASLVFNATVGRSFLAGLVLGTTLVMKPEIALAAVILTVTAAIAWTFTGRPGSYRLRGLLTAWTVGAALPTAAFVAFFSTQVPLDLAVEYACRGWLNALGTSRFIGDPSQLGFLGLDQPIRNFLLHLGATVSAILLLALACAAARLADRNREQGLSRWILPLVLVVAVAAASSFFVPWELAGRSLLGMVLVYLVYCAGGLLRERSPSPREILRLLIAVLAAALMARMMLNGRIHHFGFYQAALAALLVPAVLLGEMPDRLRLAPAGRLVLALASIALLLPGVLTLTGWSNEILRIKTYPVGEGRDRFYAYDPRIERTGEFVRTTTEQLRLVAAGREQTLLVLPDGEMINYLARMRSPVAPAIFFSSATLDGREAGIVRDLELHRPDWIVIVSRDLREFGVVRYGEQEGQGKGILAWARENYQPAAAMGGDPLDPEQKGVLLLAPK